MNRATTVRGLDGRFNIVTCYLEREGKMGPRRAAKLLRTSIGKCSAPLVLNSKQRSQNLLPRLLTYCKASDTTKSLRSVLTLAYLRR